MIRAIPALSPRRLPLWPGRILLAGVLIALTAHRRPYVILGPTQIVQTEHPITCVHTRLTDEVEEWKIQRTLQLAREMGATTIVEFFPWAYIEPQQGVYNWSHSDQIVRHARAQGLTIIARLGMVPEWALPSAEDKKIDASLNYLHPNRMQDFAFFVEAFTRHYRGQIDYIIIWNEPNLAFEWGYQEVPPQRYVSLLQFSYPAAKAGNPDVVVLAGALAPTLEPAGSPYGMNEIDYLTGFYEWGGGPYFDALAIHSYGFKFPPDEPPDPEVLNFRRAELLYAIMAANGDGDKPVFITESGWNDHPRWTKAVRPGQRITYTLDAYRYAEANWPWLDKLCTWALRYPYPTYTYHDYFTLVAEDFSPKPIYYELQAWARGRVATDP